MGLRRPARHSLCTSSIWLSLRADRLVVRRLPAPGPGAIAALCDAFLVDLFDDLAVARKQRLGRAHLGAERQFSFGEAVGAVLLILLRAAVRLRTTRAEGALVHLAARAEIADPWILRCAEGAGVEAIAAAYADVLRVQHDAVGGRIERIHRADRLARRVRTVHAGHRNRPFAGFAVLERHDAAPIDAPRHFVLILAGSNAGVAFDAPVGIAKKFHPGHAVPPYAAAI